jgi:hypothetical protein
MLTIIGAGPYGLSILAHLKSAGVPIRLTDVAALLVAQGASVQIVSREPVIFHLPPSNKPRTIWQRMRDPNIGLGPSFGAGGPLNLEADQVIAGTGYRVALERLPFQDEALLSQMRLECAYPKLSLQFESSVPGLYFVGLASAAAFGPLTRFALGAGYTARKTSAHLRSTHSRHPAELSASART